MKALSVMSIAAVAMAAALSACDGGPSAVARQDGSSARSSDRGDRNDRGSGQGSGYQRQARDEAVPQIDGRPMWAANRRHSAIQNAAYQYQRNGHDFGAADQDAYVNAAHQFIRHPPSGVRTLQRANGDRILYDPAQNIFAVATSEGAPRTFFKPRDGAAYFQREQERASRQTATRQSASNGDDDSDGDGAGGTHTG